MMKDPKVLSRPSKAPSKGKSQKQDDSIMGTNNSSIVSKRSVERLYFTEPHYFRYFVKKPQRRAPLINRGYWLRMKAVDHVVRQFLKEPSQKQKVVVNLGCGYDPLFWQCLSRYPTECTAVKFIDVDYKELMLKKRDIVQRTDELFAALSGVVVPEEGHVLLRSDQYLQLGCDLRDVSCLQQSLAAAFDIPTCDFLFTAEVSITYMDVDAADALIEWASTLPSAKFCLLEQLLPDGISHPFAQTMIAHFNKLQTPLGAVEKYPTTSTQVQRFKTLGWRDVLATNLWDLWAASDFLTSDERLSLDAVEPFDEWEEFALFGCHYILLVADNTAGRLRTRIQVLPSSSSLSEIQVVHAHVIYSENKNFNGNRKFASALPIRSPKGTHDRIGNFAGMGMRSRLASYDIYSTNEILDVTFDFTGSSSPSSRMCHTITDLGDAGALLVGGRNSPDHALADSWMYYKWLKTWERIEDLPEARYRHGCVRLSDGSVLISPGRRDSRNIGRDFFLWNRQSGWKKVDFGAGEMPTPTYGATFTVFNDLDVSNRAVLGRGLVAGGISEDGVLLLDVWEWELQSSVTHKEPTMHFIRYSGAHIDYNQQALLARFGAAVVNHHNNHTYVIGGIVKNEILGLRNEICFFPSKGCQKSGPVSTLGVTRLNPRPLLIGTSLVSIRNSLLVMGGSAVCFSFGTFWNKGSFTIHLTDGEKAHDSLELSELESSPWRYLGTGAALTTNKPLHSSRSSSAGHLTEVPRAHIQTSEEFDRILKAREPVILQGLSVGTCREKWTATYLKNRIDRRVVVHQAHSEHMDFRSKNFSYITKPFGEFIDQASNGEKVYFRSLSSENPSELPANLARDFPSIATDFQLPPELAIILENVHSSPLRISGPVIMWLHYDVMANVLCQIRGSKRLLLFPPSDVRQFQFESGASSSSINAFDNLEELVLAGAHPREAQLGEGDILFIPPFWLHTASPISGLSIAVNVFFRNLIGYAFGSDVYGNRDLQAYEKGRRDLEKMLRSFDSLPTDARNFYLQRLAEEMQQKI